MSEENDKYEISLELSSRAYETLEQFSDEIGGSFNEVIATILEIIAENCFLFKDNIKKMHLWKKATFKNKLWIYLEEIFQLGTNFKKFFNELCEKLNLHKGFFLFDIILNDTNTFNFDFILIPHKGGSDWLHDVAFEIKKDMYRLTAWNYVHREERTIKIFKALFRKIENAIKKVKESNMYYMIMDDLDGNADIFAEYEEEMITITFDCHYSMIEYLPKVNVIEKLFKRIYKYAKIEKMDQ